MNRTKRIITLPDLYWNEIDKNKDGILISSHSDALISVLNKIYPTLAQSAYHAHIIQEQNKNKIDAQMDLSNTCTCGHDRSVHMNGGCSDKEGCACKKFVLLNI